MKRVFIVHGWGGKPDAGWISWLNKELTKKEFKVFSLAMPNPEYPKMKVWIDYLKRAVGKCDENTYFVGHSIGCQTILRYIESLSDDSKVGGLFFVGGWINLKNLETDEEKKVATPWLNAPLDFNQIKPKIKKAFALFSDNDPYVSVKESKIFKEKFGAKIIIEKNKQHYFQNLTKTIPVLLNEILKETQK